MGYSTSSLQNIREAMPDRFEGQGGHKLYEQLEEIEDVAINTCGVKMSRGLPSVIENFWELYQEVPEDSSIKASFIKRGIDFDWLERRNAEQIWAYMESSEGRGRLLAIADDFERSVISMIKEERKKFKFRQGPIKEKDKILSEVFYRWPHDDESDESEVGVGDPRIRFIRDIVRGRIETEDLKAAERILSKLLCYETRAQIVSFFNTYNGLFPTRRDRNLPRPYLGCNVAFRVTKNMPYELQVMTRRAAIVGKITHNGLLLNNPVPPNVQEDAEILAWGSHICDYEEFFRNQTD